MFSRRDSQVAILLFNVLLLQQKYASIYILQIKVGLSVNELRLYKL